MYERGIVTSIDENIITIKCGKPDQCKACSSSFCNIKTKNFKALNQDGFELNEGDEVEVYISPSKTILYSFVVLIFPLLMFIAGYYLTGSVLKVESDAVRAFGGIAGLACGFVLSFMYNFLKKNQNLPVVTEKI
jgi:sigma-E factor negative regulatory protein RseC